MFCGVFTLHVARGLNAPFGFLPSAGSVDAYNGAIWSTGARALRESGPIDSKFGAVWSDERDDRYDDQTPAIYPATALSQWLVPEDELGARLLVLAASVAAAVLLFLLLCELGVVPVLAAASVGVGLSVPMFLTYGTMLDTLMLALPFAVAYILFGSEVSMVGRITLPSDAPRRRSVSSRGKASSGFRNNGGRDRRTPIANTSGRSAAGAGGAVALLVTGLWQVWVYGGLSEVLDQVPSEPGAVASRCEYVHSQLSWLVGDVRDPGGGRPRDRRRRSSRPAIPSSRLWPRSDVFLVRSRIPRGIVRPRLLNYWWSSRLCWVSGQFPPSSAAFERRVWIPRLYRAAVVSRSASRADYREESLRGRGALRDRTPATRPARGQRWVPLINDFRAPRLISELGTSAGPLLLPGAPPLHECRRSRMPDAIPTVGWC